MFKRTAVTLFIFATVVCGCRHTANNLAGHGRTPRPGEATTFGVAKGRRQVSTWTWRRGYVAIEPYADMISSVSMSSRITKVFLDNCHKADIEVYLPVAGRSAEDFATAGHIKASVRNIIKQCDELDLDGVDLQYEGFGPEWREQYTNYIITLSKKLHRRGLKLSICVNPLMLPDTGGGERYDPKVLGERCDQVRVMCYDRFRTDTGRLGPACTPAGARDAMRAWMKFVPREKLVMGLPACSHDIDMTTNTGRQVWYSKPPADSLEIIEQGNLPDEAVSYYVYRDKDRHTHVLYATDTASTEAHLATVDELDIPAVSFWTADRVTPKMWQAVRDWLESKPDVAIEAVPDIFMDSISVVVTTTLDDLNVRYTLDGREPTADSALYTKPLVLTESATVRARVFSDGRPAGFTTASRTVRKVLAPLADPPQDVIPGCRFEYYEGPWEGAPDYDALQPVAEGIAAILDLSHRKREEYFGFRFTGYIKVSRLGVYTFFVKSDDGFRLWIGDKVVVNHYGWHSAREVQGSIALNAGVYPIKADYFEWSGDEGLDVTYEGPGIQKQGIPPEALFHETGDAGSRTNAPR